MIKVTKLDKDEEYNEEIIHNLLWLCCWLMAIIITFLLINYGILHIFKEKEFIKNIPFWIIWLVLGIFVLVYMIFMCIRGYLDILLWKFFKFLIMKYKDKID
jgi:hypothetical protein